MYDILALSLKITRGRIMSDEEKIIENRKKFIAVRQYVIDEYIKISKTDGKSCKKAMNFKRAVHWFDKILFRIF